MKESYKVLSIVCLFLVVVSIGVYLGSMDEASIDNTEVGLEAIYKTGYVIGDVEVGGLTVEEANNKIKEYSINGK